MHYYQFNIGDYLTHTAHLSDHEDLAYRRMLDYCYLHEKHLPNDLDEICRLIRMRDNAKTIQAVLTDFFILTEGGWTQNRIQREIKAFKGKQNQSKKAANARWDAVTGEREELFEKFWYAGMRKVNKVKAKPIFLKLLSDTPDPKGFTESLIEDVEIRLENKQRGFNEMHPTTYLNGERWKDERYKTTDTSGNKSSAVDRVIKKITEQRGN